MAIGRIEVVGRIEMVGATGAVGRLQVAGVVGTRIPPLGVRHIEVVRVTVVTQAPPSVGRRITVVGVGCKAGCFPVQGHLLAFEGSINLLCGDPYFGF